MSQCFNLTLDTLFPKRKAFEAPRQGILNGKIKNINYFQRLIFFYLTPCEAQLFVIKKYHYLQEKLL